MISKMWIAGVVLAAVCGYGGGAEPVRENQGHPTGQYHEFFTSLAEKNRHSLSYLAKDWPDTEAWRRAGRAKMEELLGYAPEKASLEPEILGTVKKAGYTRFLVRYRVCAERTTEAFLLIPDGLQAPAPAVVALHDHGAFYYFGKEKITETENPPQILRDFVDLIYEGRYWADELTQRGFVVLAPDAFYFGSQRLEAEKLPAAVRSKLDGLEKGTDAYIKAFNRMSSQQETAMARTIFAAGATWAGIFTQGDRASVDYLLTRAEVDPNRVGCMGLSGGGFRSIHLAGLDGRIAAAAVAGFMTTYDAEAFDFLPGHTWMVYVPRQYGFLDLPDVATLNAPRPLLVLNCAQDNLFSRKGMAAAEATIAAVYGKMGASERFECRYYDEPHSLKKAAREDAFQWLEKWLK